jgi:hypothetical protein
MINPKWGASQTINVDIVKKFINPTLVVRRKHNHEKSKHFQNKWFVH